MGEILARSLWLSTPDEADPVRISIGDVLRSAARKFTDREALVFSCHEEVENVRWTFHALNEKSERLAASLLHIGYEPGDKVAIWGPNHPEWVLLEYACVKAGLVIVALDPLYKAAELSFALQTASVRGIFHADSVGKTRLADLIDAVKPDLPRLEFVHSFSQGVAGLLDLPEASPVHLAVDPDSVFMIQYTSGTTGTPKAVALTHGSVATIARNSYRCWNFGAGDRVCQGFPLYHIGGSGNSVPGSALVGATCLPVYIFKAKRTLDILEREQCTGFIGVPSMLIAMLDDPTFAARDLSRLRQIVVGGTCVPHDLLRQCEDRFGATIINSYGQTEASGVITSTVPTDTTWQKTQTSGRALPGITLKVIRHDGSIANHGVPGEICYQGPGVLTGYLNGSSPVDEKGWLHTGDIGSLDKDGYVSIFGRTREIIIRGGENISPAEVENHLIRHPDIAQAAVVGLPDKKYGEELCAAIRLSGTSKITPEEIRLWCHQNMSRWKVPRYICFVTGYPLTSSGKVQKFRLKEMMMQEFGLGDADRLQLTQVQFIGDDT